MGDFFSPTTADSPLAENLRTLRQSRENRSIQHRLTPTFITEFGPSERAPIGNYTGGARQESWAITEVA